MDKVKNDLLHVTSHFYWAQQIILSLNLTQNNDLDEILLLFDPDSAADFST